MSFVKVINQEAVSYPYSDYQLRKEYRNISFPAVMSNTIRASYGMYPVTIEDKPDYDVATQKAVQNTLPTLNEETDTWVLGWTVSDMSEEEIAENDALWASKNRTVRDNLLTETDWVVIKALEEGQPVDLIWQGYRHELRMVPQQEGFPHNINWPTKPV